MAQPLQDGPLGVEPDPGEGPRGGVRLGGGLTVGIGAEKLATRLGFVERLPEPTTRALPFDTRVTGG
jgi:hypothetical protein